MRQKKPFGFDLLRRQLFETVECEFSELDGWVQGDSEIERLFHAALIFCIRYGPTEFAGVSIAISPDHAERLRAEDYYRRFVIVESQVEIDKYRVDFVVSAWTYGVVYAGSGGWIRGEPRWRKLIVECDGHEFHERTKQQAARDRSRDRVLTSNGYELFRFTGSELWRDPWGCADQVNEWAINGFSWVPGAL